jgi:predicted Zn-dependent protease
LKGPSLPKFQPIIYEYLKKFQEDPSSRVFAPLAEAYRKAGLPDEAISVAREGLQFHPRFMGGRVALARALFDKKQYQEVIEELYPVVQDVPDNLIAQRLLAESYLFQGRLAEALSSYKILLFFSPNDQEAARMVQELEVQAYENGTLVLRTDPGSKKMNRIQRIEYLQGLLQKVERYRVRSELAG